MQVHIHPLITIYINTLLAWAKCFLATDGVYPGLYDILDTPRRGYLTAQLHLHDSTLPRPLLHRSRGPPTLQNECVDLKPHLAPSALPNCLYICQKTNPSFIMSVCSVTSPSIILPAPIICLSTHESVALSICTMASPSVIPVHLSYQQSIHPPISPGHRPSYCPSPSNHLYTILPHPSGCPTLSDLTSTILTSLSDRPSLPDCLYVL